MGGYGSGRRGSKNTTESQYRIDIRWLRKQGFLQPGAVRSLSWSCLLQPAGKQTGSSYEKGSENKGTAWGKR
jgi:hypothetical protein